MKSTIQARDEQVALILEELEKDIESFKIAIQKQRQTAHRFRKNLKTSQGRISKTDERKQIFKRIYIKKPTATKATTTKTETYFKPRPKINI